MLRKPTYLYIKQHSITGLKYFGKTSSQDPYLYNGSGTYWRRHIKKHGIMHITTLWVSEPYTSLELIQEYALQFSIDNNIINSTEWANLKLENGIDGGWDYVNANHLNRYENWSVESKNKHATGSAQGGINCLAQKKGIHGMTTEQRSTNGKSSIKQTQQIMLAKYGVISLFSIFNKDKTFNDKKKEIYKTIKHQQGSKNSQFGSMWITNGIDNKKIIKDNVIPDGWRKGRVMKK